MITVSQLKAFDAASWGTGGEWARSEAKLATEIATEVEAQAHQLAKAWPSWVGQLAVNALNNLALSYTELAVSYTDAATVIDDATTTMTGLRAQILQVESDVVARPQLSGPDDTGAVTSTIKFTLDTLIEFFQGLGHAHQLTLKAREILMQATDQDRTASIALLALIGVDLPPSNDGPIDLSDDGIVLQADLNSQDRYGDCTTLSTLISIAHSDPDFVRRHMEWDPATGTYQVTLYDNGKAVTVSVDPSTLPTDGSQQAATNKPSWLSIYEQAIQQQFGDITDGKFEDVPIARITGHDVPLGPPPSADDIRKAMDHDPPGVVTADTANAPQQPDGVDPSKRVVPGHTYSVRGVDPDGNVILQNPWGPAGGWHDGKYYPGQVHLTPEEYEKWFSNGAVLNPPY